MFGLVADHTKCFARSLLYLDSGDSKPIHTEEMPSSTSSCRAFWA